MEPITLALLALGGVALLGGKKSGKIKSAQNGWGIKGEEDRLHYLNEIRSMSNWASAKYGMMPNLNDYLTAVGYWESRFNPYATNPEIKTNPANAARGLFGMRPNSAFKDDYKYMRSTPNALYNPRWSFVAAVNHIAGAAAAVEREGSGTPNWLSAKRWWTLPKLVHDFNEFESKSVSVRENLEEAIYECNQKYGTNMDPDFIWLPIQADNYPGMNELVRAFGLQGVT